MSFIANAPLKPSYRPGWFLADDEDCTRVTMTIADDDDSVVTTDDGAKYVPMGAPVFDSDTIIGFLYEDVDVSEGDAPGSVVIAGHIYSDVIPALYDGDLSAFSVVTRPTITRPEFDYAEPDDEENDG